MIWLGHSFYKHLCNLQADLRVTLDCWISYLIYSHREKEAHQLPWACEIQNPQRQSYYCSEAVSMVVSFFRARALSFRVSSGFFFFFTFFTSVFPYRASVSGPRWRQLRGDVLCDGSLKALPSFINYNHSIIRGIMILSISPLLHLRWR